MKRNLIKSIARECRDFSHHLTAKTKLVFCKNNILNVQFERDLLEKKWNNNHISCVKETGTLPDIQLDLSIIIPLYNSEKFLIKCMDSFLNQSTKYAYEIILIDDGSTDKTSDMAQKYREEYPQIVRLISQKNQGISAARNAGIESARGRYIGFADHDDWVTEDYIEELLSAAYAEDADIVKCSYATVKNGLISEVSKLRKNVIRGSMKENLYLYSSFIWGGIQQKVIRTCSISSRILV